MIDKTIEEIKSQLLTTLNRMGIKVKSIILFGSRARGDSAKHSDYDILVITEKTFTIERKIEISKRLNQALAELLIPSDIIIKSAEEAECLRHQIGSVVKEALQEGIEV